jgi:hypothetical protein
MKLLSVPAAILGGVMLIAAPAFAQSTPDQSAQNQKTAQKQHTQGYSDGGFDTGPGSKATTGVGASATKQRTDGGYSDGGFDTGPASKAAPR